MPLPLLTVFVRPEELPVPSDSKNKEYDIQDGTAQKEALIESLYVFTAVNITSYQLN